MKIQLLGAHNVETDTARLPGLLVDGVIALDAGGLTSCLSLEAQGKIRAVLLTHHHFDHTRDLVTLGMNNTIPPSTVDVYGLRETLEVVYLYLLDGKLYKDFTLAPADGSPRMQLKPVAPYQQLLIEGLMVMPVPVRHAVSAVGYAVASGAGNGIFYTGDTGPGLQECWERISPRVLFIEVTGLNRMEEAMLRLGHMTPALLAGELKQFRELKGYLPRVIVTHLPLQIEAELRAELEQAGKELGMEIEVGYEGLTIDI